MTEAQRMYIGCGLFLISLGIVEYFYPHEPSGKWASFTRALLAFGEKGVAVFFLALGVLALAWGIISYFGDNKGRDK